MLQRIIFINRNIYSNTNQEQIYPIFSKEVAAPKGLHKSKRVLSSAALCPLITVHREGG